MADQGGWVYSDKVKDHFMNPRNILRDEKEFKYDGKGMTGNVKCGDEMIMFISASYTAIATLRIIFGSYFRRFSVFLIALAHSPACFKSLP